MARLFVRTRICPIIYCCMGFYLQFTQKISCNHMLCAKSTSYGETMMPVCSCEIPPNDVGERLLLGCLLCILEATVLYLISKEHVREISHTVVATVGFRLCNATVKLAQRTAICWPACRPKPRTRSHCCCAVPWFLICLCPLSLYLFVSISLSCRASASEFSRLVLVLEGVEEESHRRRSRRPARWAVSGYCIGYG